MHRAITTPSGLLSCVLLVALATPNPAQADRPNASCDTTNIRWVLPGDFVAARQRAVAEQRLLLIKGISFGVDAAGAKCATDGMW